MEYLRLFRHLNFSKLWFAQILTQVGQHLLNFSLIILVYELAKGTQFANLSVALLVIAFGLPSLLFAPFAGLLVDYWDRKRILFVTNILRAGLVLLFPIWDTNLLLILLLSFAISSIMQLFMPAETATIPNTVPKSLLLPANSLFIFSVYASFILGYSLSGPVVQLLGNKGPYWAVAGMLLVAAALIALLPKQPVERPEGGYPRPHIWKTMSENWKLVNANRDRYFSILQLTVTHAVVSILVTLAPALSIALLHIPLQQASHVIVIPVGIGMIVGVMLVNVVTRKRAKATVVQAGLIAAALTLTAVGLSGQLWRTYEGDTIIPVASIALVVGTLMLLLGMLNSMVSATAQTMLQESTGDRYRGKVFASLNMMVNLAATAPILIVGLMADLLSVTKVITLMGAMLTAYAIYMTYHYRARMARDLLHGK